MPQGLKPRFVVACNVWAKQAAEKPHESPKRPDREPIWAWQSIKKFKRLACRASHRSWFSRNRVFPQPVKPRFVVVCNVWAKAQTYLEAKAGTG